MSLYANSTNDAMRTLVPTCAVAERFSLLTKVPSWILAYAPLGNKALLCAPALFSQLLGSDTQLQEPLAGVTLAAAPVPTTHRVCKRQQQVVLQRYWIVAAPEN